MKQSRRELNKMLCRQRILRASRQLFRTKGYEATTIEDVAAQAEISKATLYNYFPSKDSLLLGIAESEIAQVRTLLSERLDPEASVVERLRSVTHQVVRNAIPDLALCRKITYLNSCEDSDLYAARTGLTELVQNLAEEGVRRGEFRQDVEVREIVDLVMGVYLMAQFQWSDLDGLSEEACQQRLDRLFARMLASVLV